MKTTIERRRVRVQLPGCLQGSVSLRMDVQVINLSVDGAMIEHTAVLSPGAIFPLFLKIGGVDLCLRAHIVWSHVHSARKGENGDGEIRFRTGLNFRDVPKDVRAHLERYITAVSPAESDPQEGQD